MIDVKELMIDNWVFDDINNEYVQIKSIIQYELQSGTSYEINPINHDGYSYFGEGPENFSPIGLTDKILEKCGFVKHKNSNEYWSFWKLSNGWYISESHHDEPAAGVKRGNFYWGDNYWEVNSLHHLQNFYYNLTRKQLEIQL